MQGNIKTVANPYEPIKPNSVLVLDANLETKAYLENLKLAFLMRGYKAAYPRETLPAKVYPDYQVDVDAKTESQIIQSQEPIYGNVNTGGWVQDCRKEKGATRCISRPETRWDVVGYRPVNEQVDNYTLTMNWFPLKSGQTKASAKQESVLQVTAQTTQKGCDPNRIYAFLIQQAVNRFTPERNSASNFKVEMPEGYSCR
ncbi:hypothetical protein ACKC9G_01770 [Pokkaliibacter sp. CJK22405]|uniref:hypothetical protein n=1 Tax=Pokkaliibacter sp. CJK22405 TaxID=3384615 RepID=UPI003984F142